MNKKQLIKILRSIGNPRRLEIILYLKKYGTLNVGGIAEKLDLSFRSTSRHLQSLASADLVIRKQQSQTVFYSLSSEIPKVIENIFVRINP